MSIHSCNAQKLMVTLLLFFPLDSISQSCTTFYYDDPDFTIFNPQWIVSEGIDSIVEYEYLDSLNPVLLSTRIKHYDEHGRKTSQISYITHHDPDDLEFKKIVWLYSYRKKGKAIIRSTVTKWYKTKQDTSYRIDSTLFPDQLVNIHELDSGNNNGMYNVQLNDSGVIKSIKSKEIGLKTIFNYPSPDSIRLTFEDSNPDWKPNALIVLDSQGNVLSVDASFFTPKGFQYDENGILKRSFYLTSVPLRYTEYVYYK